MNGEVGRFLRARRALLAPEQLGLSDVGRRRVRGLRREEVAQLAGVSVDYYTRLEQGRSRNVSDALLEAIGNVLGLTSIEHEYVRNLARARSTDTPADASASVLQTRLKRLIDLMGELPAVIVGPHWRILAWNTLAYDVFDLGSMAPHDFSVPRYVFLEPRARILYTDWDALARQVAAGLRRDAGRNPADPVFAELIANLSTQSPDFRALWNHHVVRPHHTGVVGYRHPVAGELELYAEPLFLDDPPGHMVMTWSYDRGSLTDERLRLIERCSNDAQGGPGTAHAGAGPRAASPGRTG